MTDAVARPPAELRIDLDTPLIIAGGEAVDHLVLREPTIGELAECDALSGYAWMAKLIQLTTSLPLSTVKQLPVSAGNKAGAYLTGFIDADRTTRSASLTQIGLAYHVFPPELEKYTWSVVMKWHASTFAVPKNS